MPGLSKQGGPMSKQASLSKAASLSKKSSLSKTASLSKKASLSKTTSLSKQGSLNKQASSSNVTSLQKKLTIPAFEKQTSSKIVAKKRSSVISVSKKQSLTKTSTAHLQKQGSTNGTVQKTASMKKQVSGPGRLRKRKAKLVAAPAEADEVPAKKQRKSQKKTKKPARELLYRCSEFLALRDDKDGFFLARCQQLVWDDTTKFRIQWLDVDAEADDVFHVSYTDTTLPECVITHVKLIKVKKDEYRLPDRQRRKIEMELNRALGKVDEKEEKVPKKKTVKKAALKKQVSTKAKKTSAKGKASKVKEEKDKKVKEAKKKKVPLTEEERRDPNRRLKPNADVTLYTEDPLLYSKEPVPFVSVTAQSKLVARSVCVNDMKMLKSYIGDRKKIAKMTARHSCTVEQDAIHRAIDAGNSNAIQLLIKESPHKSGKKAERVDMTSSLLETQGTGRYNYRSLGVSAIRALSMSRGSREGNNALTKDLGYQVTSDASIDEYISHAIRSGASLDIINTILNSSDYATNRNIIHEKVYLAVRYGHRKLAGEIVKQLETLPFNPFNFLHKEVLLFDSEDLGKFRAMSVKKKPFNNAGMTPIHAAAINPNVNYLSQLLAALPEYSITDNNQKKPIHYAAACEKTGPIDFLIKRGQEPNDPDGSGMTCLMIACETNRPHIISFLLNKAKQDSEEEAAGPVDEDDINGRGTDKYGLGGINRPCLKPSNSNYNSFCPLHIASHLGHLECVKVLVQHGADVKAVTGPKNNKLTPMMLAASRGHLEVVSFLRSSGAPVEQNDKLKKTALIHAVMNGQAHIVSYLLRIGANPNQADTSGNTCIHYAAAYGWYFCLKLLLQAGANANTPNDWKITPLGISFLKGHIGLADVLLGDPSVEINFCDDQGMTLVAVACSSPLQDTIVDQLKYLAVDKNAVCDITDINGRSPLHHLAMNNVSILGDEKSIKEGQKRRIEMANILLSRGCDANLRDNEGFTPLLYAVEQNDHGLIEFLVSHGGSVSTVQDKNGKNVLHIMAQKCMTTAMAALLKIIAKPMSKSDLKEMSGQVDDQGFTPLLRACQSYSTWNGVLTKTIGGVVDDDDDDDDDDEMNDDDDDDDDDDEMNDEEEEVNEDQDTEMDQDDSADQAMTEDDDADDDEGKDEDAEEDEPMDEDDEDNDTEDDHPVDTSSLDKVDSDVVRQWEAGRNFIKALVTICAADINAQVQPRTFKPGEKVPEKEADRYVAKYGKKSAVFFMLNVQHEAFFNNEKHPGLAQVVALSADLSLRDLDQRTPLHVAILTKRSSVALKLIQSGANLNEASGNEKEDGLAEPLVLAAKGAMDELVTVLLKKKACVTSSDSNNRYTALHYAAANPTGWGHCLEVLKQMLKHGADVNAVDKYQRTPLHLAVNANQGGIDISSEVEQFLIDSDADVFAVDHRNRLPLHYAFVKIGRPYLSTSIDPIELCSTLTAAMGTKQMSEADEFGQTPLHCAAVRGAGVCCMHLLQKGAAIDARDNLENTPLSCAVNYGHESTSIMLIQREASINVDIHTPPPIKPELTPEQEEKKKKEKPRWLPAALRTTTKDETPPKPLFQGVVEREWQGVIFIMLDLLSKAGIHYTDTIQTALETYKYNLAMTLIRKRGSGVKLGRVNEQERNLLHVLASTSKFNGDLENRVVDMLVSGGVDVAARDVHGCTPLHYAALRRNTGLVQLLLKKKGVVAESEDDFGRTPMAALFWTSSLKDTNKLFDCVRLLHKAGASVNVLCDYPGVPPLGTLKAFPVTIYGKPTWEACVSPLILTIKQRNFSAIKMLIEQGASVNMPDEKKMTPLMHAVCANDIHIVRLLLDSSYNPSKEDLEKSPTVTRKTAKKKKTAHGRRAFTLGKSKLQQPDSDDEEDEEDEEDATPIAPLEDVNLTFPTFQKKSDVDVGAVDEAGRTVIHHLAMPSQFGSYDNIQLLKILADAKAPLNQADSSGLTPLDLALAKGVPLLSKALQKLMGKRKESWERPTYGRFAVNDGMTWEGDVPTYRADAKAFIADTEADMADEAEETGYEIVPDSQLAMDKTGEVLKDEEMDIYYDVLLSKIDVRVGAWGLFNFYKMQVVYQKAKDMYVLFNRWGRFGDEGQFQKTPFQKCADVTKEFAKIFRAKTGNDWKNIKEFEVKNKKYRLVDTDRRKPMAKQREIELDLKSTLPSKLPAEVQDVLKELTDVSTMNNSIKKLGVDLATMPFGSISKENLTKARSFLADILELVRSVTKRGSKNPIDDEEAYMQELMKISELTSEYYHLVPQPGYQFERILPLTSEDAVGEQWNHLSTLMELEFVKAMLAGAQYRIKDVNPLDYVYRCMGVQLQMMGVDEDEAQALLHYVHKSSDTQRHCKVEGIFRVSRPGEDKRIKGCNLENHRLLFHGSSSSNLLSILTRGLLIAPPEAPTTGWAFGKGIYMADKFAKSEGYCHNWNHNSNTKFMLVCETALGNICELHSSEYMEKAKSGFHSTQYVGKEGPDPDQSLTLPTGVVMPIGDSKKQERENAPYWRTQHNEFIVYNADQVALRYIIQFQ